MAYNPSIGSIYHLYTTYIPLIFWVVICDRSHLLWGPFQQPLNTPLSFAGRRLHETKDSGLAVQVRELIIVWIWVFLRIGVSQNGWFIMVPNPIKMDDLGGPPLFLEAPIWRCTRGFISVALEWWNWMVEVDLYYEVHILVQWPPANIC